MNRNEQVNGEKMWEYISNIGKAIRKYRTGIAVTTCSLVLGLSSIACEGDNLNMAGPGKPYSWLTDEERAAQQARPTVRVNVNYNDGIKQSTEELRRLNKQLELENSLRIRRMQLELKRREAERKLQELNRQLNR